MVGCAPGCRIGWLGALDVSPVIHVPQMSTPWSTALRQPGCINSRKGSRVDTSVGLSVPWEQWTCLRESSDEEHDGDGEVVHCSRRKEAD